MREERCAFCKSWKEYSQVLDCQRFFAFCKKKKKIIIIKNDYLYRLESTGDFSAQSSAIVTWQKERKNHLGMTEVRMIFLYLSGAQKYLRERD